MGVVRIPARPLFAVTLLLLTASIAAACSRGSESVAGPGERAMGAASTSPSPEPSFDPPIDPDIGINNISHVIVIVQENRSFDHYFGTFPGADGYPRDANGHIDVCVPDPEAGHCQRPYHDTNRFDAGGPHGLVGSRISENGGRMDGYVRALEQIGNGCEHRPDDYPCRQARRGPAGQPDIMGYHTAKEIPNYWAYAKHFVLQDHMFAPESSWTLPAHLFLVSAWAATCPDLGDPDELSFGPGVPGRERRRPRQEDVDPGGRGAAAVRLGRHHVAAAPARRELGVLRGVGDVLAARMWPLAGPRGHRARPEHPAGVQDRRGRPPTREHPVERALLRRGRRGHAAQGVVGDAHHEPRGAPAGRHRERTGVGDEGGQRGDARTRLAAHGDLRHVGRLGRVLRSRATAQGGCERLRDPRARP